MWIVKKGLAYVDVNGDPWAAPGRAARFELRSAAERFAQQVGGRVVRLVKKP